MTLLVLGILLFAVPHWFKRLAPQARAGMGDAGKMAVALLRASRGHLAPRPKAREHLDPLPEYEL